MLKEKAILNGIDKFLFFTFRSMCGCPRFPVDIFEIEISDNTSMAIILFSDDIKKLNEFSVINIRCLGLGRTTLDLHLLSELQSDSIRQN